MHKFQVNNSFILERSKRQIAQKHAVDVKLGDDIGALNAKLADKGTYNRLVQKQI
ncbi:MAG: hypothetical protein ACYCXQ_12795 [Candidatus Humimicrobiaceae bacterium]